MTRFISNLKLLHKLAIPAAVLLALCVSIVWYGASGLSHLSGETADLVDHEAARATAALEMGMQLYSASSNLGNVLIDKQEAEKKAFAAAFSQDMEEARHNLDQLIALSDTAERRSRNESAKRELQEYAKVGERVIDLAMRNDGVSAFALSNGEGRSALKKLTEFVEARVTNNKAELLKGKQDAAELAGSTTRALMMSSAIGLVVALGFLLWIAIYQVARPLDGMAASMADLAKGNLGIAVLGTERRDEVGSLARSLEVFKQNMIEADRLAAEQRAEQERKEKQRLEMESFIRDFEAVATAAAAGDFTRRIDLRDRTGQLEQLSVTLNDMVTAVHRAIDELAGMLGGMAEGDLTRRVAGDYQGMLERLKTDANRTADRLAGTISQIVESSAMVGSAASEIAAGSADLSARTEQQASNLEETAASMEELSATVRQNSENAQQANQLATTAREAADRGGKVTTQAVEAMTRIEGASQKISDIIGVIDEIAFQTNLLALNAAVEAARAGEAGKGFAVVASEVRTLAQRSAQASKEIKALILDSGNQVKDGVKLAHAAGEALEGIVGSVKKVADIVSEIAAASAEQASGVEQVNSAVTQMDEMTQKNAALVEESAAAARSLEEQAAEMTRLMAFFSTGQEHEGRHPAGNALTGNPVVDRALGSAGKVAAPGPAPIAKRRAGGGSDWKQF